MNFKKIFLLFALILLTTANVAAAEDTEIPFDTVATTYTDGAREMLALVKMKSDGTPAFIVMAEEVQGMGLVPYTKELYDFYLNKTEFGDYPPLIFGMLVFNQERGQLDDDLGAWKEGMHLIPVYAMFHVENGQVVCGKPFSSATDVNSTHFHATIQNPNHIKLVETFMTQMPRLHEIIQANNIALP